MMLPDAILLDLDDTIVAFDAVADDCWLSLCKRYAAEISSVDADRLFLAIYRAREWFWSDLKRHQTGRRDLQSAQRQVVKRAFDELDLDREDVALRLADNYSDERERLVQPFPRALETLVELRRRGVELALLTNGEARIQRSKIERFDLARHFKYVLIEGEFGIGKPDHGVFAHALRALGREPQEAWMIGDSLTFDIAPAVELGIEAIWVDNTGKGLPESALCKPNRIVRNIADVLSE